jgi:general secretion pathway protein K
VLWLSAALSAIVFAMSMTVRGETDRTATSMDDLRSYYLASAGVQKAIVELLFTMNNAAGLIDRNAPSIDYQFPSGVTHVDIIPEAAKINVNRASGDQLVALMNGLGVDPARAGTIADGIIDWRTPNGGGSPFDAYYFSLTPSFQAPHTSIQEIEEILSVRGVTPEIFYGTWAAAGTGDAGENPLVRHPGLIDCLTVYGSMSGGDVNVALAAAGLGADGAVPVLGGSYLPNPIVTFRATARLKLSNGQFSDMRRTVGAQVRFLPFMASERPFEVLRWYDTTWSY